jgi:hypothetical protein
VLKRARQYQQGTCAPDSSSLLSSGSTATSSTPTSTTGPAATADDLLGSSSVELAPAAASDLESGIVDSRLISLLAWIAQRHSIAISEFKTGHSKYVTGTTKVSNNWYGRAATITWVDGKAVSPGSSAARTLWNQLRTAPAAIRPIEIGAPWADPANSRFYSGSDAQNVIHIGFDGPTQH